MKTIYAIDYADNDEKFCVVEIPVIKEDEFDGETFNYVLLMCKDGELLEVIRPIKELSQDKIVFHTNFALNEREFVLSIATGNGVYKTIKLEAKK